MSVTCVSDERRCRLELEARAGDLRFHDDKQSHNCMPDHVAVQWWWCSSRRCGMVLLAVPLTMFSGGGGTTAHTIAQPCRRRLLQHRATVAKDWLCVDMDHRTANLVDVGNFYFNRSLLSPSAPPSIPPVLKCVCVISSANSRNMCERCTIANKSSTSASTIS
jgi:hypothetical protein